MAEEVRGVSNEYEEEEIDRRDTGVRIALTLLFVLIAAAIESVLTLIVVFQLLWTLATRQAPSRRLRELANRIIAYYYRIGRYLTYNESRLPFPFADFPASLEGDAWNPDERESEALGLPQWKPGDDRDDVEEELR